MHSPDTVGPPSEKTERNLRRARCHGGWVGPYHVEWKLRTGQWYWRPRSQVTRTEFWNEGPVQWFRCYWFSVGLSIYRLIPERRNLATRQINEIFFRWNKEI